jgi:DNA-directed RNA polymerase subunit RPC12/RpoP
MTDNSERMSDKKFDCVTCGYNNEDENYLIEKTGEIVCPKCMTTERSNLWNCQNFSYNPDSYDGVAPCPPELNCGHFVPCQECQGDIEEGDEPCYACAYAGGKMQYDARLCFRTLMAEINAERTHRVTEHG